MFGQRLQTFGALLGATGLLSMGMVGGGLAASTPAAATLCPQGAVQSGTTCIETFVYSGAVQTWTVPAGLTQATFDLYGAAGGDSGGTSFPHQAGGKGAHVHAVLNVASGTLDVLVGGRGSTD